MKIEFNQTTVTIAACVVMAVFMFGKNFLVSNAPSEQPRQQGAIKISEKESSEARFKRENRNIELPTGDKLETEYINNKIKQFTEIPFGDEELEYSILLPNDWVRSNFAQFGLPGEEKYLILTNIARYFGPAIGDMRPFVWLEALRLKREITAKDYMYGYFANRGLSPETVRVYSEKQAEALFVEVQDNQSSFAVRARFIIHGDTLVLLRMGVPVLSYKKAKELIGYSLASFSLKQPINRIIEEKKTFKLLNVLSFNHLTSWKTAQVEKNSTLKTGMELQNFHKAGGLNGVIYIRAYRKSSQINEDKLWPEITQLLSDRGFSILGEKPDAQLPSPENIEQYDDFSQKSYEITFKALLKKTDFDIERDEKDLIRQTMHVTRIDNGNYIVYAILVTPDSNKYYMTWAHNMFAYDLLLDTLKIRERTTIQ